MKKPEWRFYRYVPQPSCARITQDTRAIHGTVELSSRCILSAASSQSSGIRELPIPSPRKGVAPYRIRPHSFDTGGTSSPKSRLVETHHPRVSLRRQGGLFTRYTNEGNRFFDNDTQVRTVVAFPQPPFLPARPRTPRVNIVLLAADTRATLY